MITGQTFYREPHISGHPAEDGVFHQAQKAEITLVRHGVSMHAAGQLTFGVLCSGRVPDDNYIAARIPTPCQERYRVFIDAYVSYKQWIRSATAA